MLEIVTERLVLRPLQFGDVPAFATYRSDPDVARYQSWDTTYSTADAERLVAAQRDVALGDQGPWLQLAAVDRVSGALCGDCAVRAAIDQRRTAEVGVTFAPRCRGADWPRRRSEPWWHGCSSSMESIASSPRPTTATFPSTAFSNGSASDARRAWSRPTGSRASGPRFASTRACAENGAHRLRRTAPPRRRALRVRLT